jgi:hypothetical protein
MGEVKKIESIAPDGNRNVSGSARNDATVPTARPNEH